MGTGQSVKITEAISQRVPVMALSRIAAESPIKHRINGLIAHTTEEFIGYVCLLWNYRELCRQYGNAARADIRAQFYAQTSICYPGPADK